MADRVLVTPPGLQDQMYRGDGGPQRMPTPPRQANTLVVGGPAYFTPEGYQAPYQPEQSFMPTNVAPDPIRDQFNRMNPTPPPPPPQAPTPAPTPAPISDPEPVVDPVEEPVVEPDFPIYGGPAQPYIPGLTPFPGIPGLGDLDFSGLPGMGDIDIDAIIQEYQDRIDAGEPEPFDSFLPTQPKFVPPPQEPNGFFPGIDTPEDFESRPLTETLGGPMEFGEARKRAIMTGTRMPNPADYDMSPLGPKGPMPPTTTPGRQFDPIGQYDYKGPLSDIDIPPSTTTGPLTGTFGNFGPFTPPPMPEGMMDDYDFGNPNLRNMRGFDPRR